MELSYDQISEPPIKGVVDDDFLELYPLQHWNKIEAELSKPIHNLKDLAIVIKSVTDEQFKKFDDNQFINSIRNYQNERKMSKEEFLKIINNMTKIALEMPKLFPEKKIKFLCKGKEGSLILSRQQIACLLCHAFFCTHQSRPVGGPMPIINLMSLYLKLNRSPEEAKFLSILNYFDCITKQQRTGYLKFHRKCLAVEEFPDFSKSQKKLCNITLHQDGCIEDAKDSLQIDFANKLIGGGVILGGCVQEEIRFAVSTELIVSCLFCEEMGACEAIEIIGSERFSSYKGYGGSLQYNGSFNDDTEFIKIGDYEYLNCTLSAIDAVDFRNCGEREQYSEDLLIREIRKAYVGFKTHDETKKPIATGNWGCGAFLGNKSFKFLIQVLAASEAERDLTFYTFGDPQIYQKFHLALQTDQLKNITVSQLYNSLLSYNNWSESYGGDILSMLTNNNEAKHGYAFVFDRCSLL